MTRAGKSRRVTHSEGVYGLKSVVTIWKFLTFLFLDLCFVPEVPGDSGAWYWGLGLSAYVGPSFSLRPSHPMTSPQPPAYRPFPGPLPTSTPGGIWEKAERVVMGHMALCAKSPPESCAPVQVGLCLAMCILHGGDSSTSNSKWKTKSRWKREREMVEKREKMVFPPDVWTRALTFLSALSSANYVATPG